MDSRFPSLIILPSYGPDSRDYLQYGLRGNAEFEAGGPSAARLSDHANLAAGQNHREMGSSSWILHDESRSVISSNKNGTFLHSDKDADMIWREADLFERFAIVCRIVVHSR